MLTVRLSVIIALISLIFFSCKKEDQSNSQGDLLKMIRIKEGDSIFYRSFQYDDQNTLTAIFDSNNNGHKRSFIITYDAQGRIANVATNAGTYTFEFDNDGRITKKSTIVTGRQTVTVENTYSYDNSGRLIADSVYSYWTKDVDRIVSYSYDQNNNVIESKTVDKSTGALLVQEECVYDNHPNPLDGKKVMTYLLSSGYEIPLQGKNNLLKEIYQDGTTVNYTYEYLSNGLPKRCSFQDNFDPLVTFIDYYYE